jgi:UDP-GlcNAc:undecaprenyl-phosphate/decaprenyl-phosphate GlcNAc-1-phosphate transferase
VKSAVPPKWQSGAAVALAAAGAARIAYAALTRTPPGGVKTWQRTNHRGEPVTLLEGPAVALGAIAIQFFYPERTAVTHHAQSRSLALAGLGGLGFGIVDDLAGSGKHRGLRGHLAALTHGEVTTGTVKLAGLGATGLASSVLLGGDPADIAINAGLIAGGANLLNLFDLRPGRAIKVATGSAALIAVGAGATGTTGATAVAAPVGAALALLPDDLGERAMLGDAGANAIGAMLGAAAAASLPRSARLALLTGIVGLTAASEKVSFTKVIERTRPLRWLDMLGRRQAAPAAPAASLPPRPEP